MKEGGGGGGGLGKLVKPSVLLPDQETLHVHGNKAAIFFDIGSLLII